MRAPTTAVIGACLLLGCTTAHGGASPGERAQLFKSLDENLNPVDMADLIKGKPLVVTVGSAS